jgi:hypothetical protein
MKIDCKSLRAEIEIFVVKSLLRFDADYHIDTKHGICGLHEKILGENKVKKMNLMVAILILTIASNSVLATQTVKLNTGYNHSLLVDAPYAPIPPATQDNYWIRVWSTYYGGVKAPAWAVPVASPWFPTVLPGSNWINAQNSNASTPGTLPTNPAYHLYRKCFCLLQGFNQATMNFSFRADDGVAVWFNGSWVVPFSAGNWNLPNPYTKNVTSGFTTGRNCIYVLIGDRGTYTGFDLAGNVTANGLLPTPAFGVGATFQPCGCGVPSPANGQQTMKINDNGDDTQVIEEIVKSVKSNQRTNTEIMNKAIEMPRSSDTKN